jgi:hypothetical protein
LSLEDPLPFQDSFRKGAPVVVVILTFAMVALVSITVASSISSMNRHGRP